MHIIIKNMVSVRCKMIVKTVLDAQGILYEEVELGSVTLTSALTSEEKIELNAALKYYDLELLDTARHVLVEQIKVSIIERVQAASGKNTVKFSELLSRKLHHDYGYLANIFFESEKSTIEKFYILKKVERVKELLLYDGMSIKEISYQMNYSSVSHLCKQFKAVTGVTPARFKKLSQTQNIAS